MTEKVIRVAKYYYVMDALVGGYTGLQVDTPQGIKDEVLNYRLDDLKYNRLGVIRGFPDVPECWFPQEWAQSHNSSS